MNNRYYSLPLDASKLISSKTHNTCSLKESISHYIHLINTSYLGECTFDESFGCSVWLIDFDNLTSANRLNSLIQESLTEALRKNELRIGNIRVGVKMKQEELFGMKDSNRIKKRVDIKVNAKVVKTNEIFSYVEYFYIGPLSY